MRSNDVAVQILQPEFVGSSLPCGIGLFTECLGSFCCVLEVRFRHTDGECIIIHLLAAVFVAVPLVSAGNTNDVAVIFDTAHPEVSRTAQYRVAYIMQPLFVLRELVVLPACDGYIARYVLFERRIHRMRACLFLSGAGTFPRKHSTFVSVHVCIVHSHWQTFGTILQHLPCEIGLHEQQDREHPRFAIPEHMSCVAQARQSHRRAAEGITLAEESI